MGNIFISYRRSDSGPVSGRIADSLRTVFGANSVFRDLTDIHSGVDFRSAINQAFDRSQVVLVIIGPSWFGTLDAQGRPHIFDPDDSVRIEIEAALLRRIPIFPVLVLGAQMPSPQQLPATLAQLSFINAIEIHDDPLYSGDLNRLIQAIAYFIPLLPTSQSTMQQQATAAYIQAQQLGQQFTPVAKTIGAGLAIFGAIFGIIFAIAGAGFFAYDRSFSNLFNQTASSLPDSSGFQSAGNSFSFLFQTISLGFVLIGILISVISITALVRANRRRSA